VPTPGTTLAGFLPEPEAIQLLRHQCIVADTSDAALSAEWAAARAKLGAPTPNAGLPNIQPLPADGMAYVAQLVQQPWVQESFRANPALIGSTYQLVELDPLLAYQYSVDIARSNHHTNGVQTPTLGELLNICLPMNQSVEPLEWAKAPGSMMVTARNLNFRALMTGYFPGAPGGFLGVAVGLSVPFMHVTRYNGKCYLHNGYHRAVGLRACGVTHVPCMVRDVTGQAEAGIQPPGTFDLPLLESADPPTIAHLASGRGYDVQLKVFRRTLHISWAEYATTIE